MLEFIKNNKGLVIALGSAVTGFIFEATRANKLQEELLNCKNDVESLKFELKQAEYKLDKTLYRDDSTK